MPTETYMPYEEELTFPQPWDIVFDAAQRCCERVPKAVLASADAATGRVVVVMRGSFWIGYGAVLLVDVGAAAEGGSVVRIGAMSAFPYDNRSALRFHASRYRKALLDELASPDVYSAPEREVSP